MSEHLPGREARINEMGERYAAQYGRFLTPFFAGDQAGFLQELSQGDGEFLAPIAYLQSDAALDRALSDVPFLRVREFTTVLAQALPRDLSLGNTAAAISLLGDALPPPDLCQGEHVDEATREARENRRAYFISTFVRLAAWQTDIAELQAMDLHAEELLPFFQARFDRFGDTTLVPEGWHYRNIRILLGAVEERRRAEKFIQEGPAAPLATKKLQRLQNENGLLSRRLSRRGLSVDTMVSDAHKWWHVQDAFDLRSQMLAQTEAINARVKPYTWPMAEYQALAVPPGEEVAQVELLMADNPVRTSPGDLRFIDKAGQLYFDVHCAVPAKPVYRRLGRLAEYEQLRKSLMQGILANGTAQP